MPTLLDALNAAQYTTADDPFAASGIAIGRALPSLVNPYGSVGTNAAVVLGGGLLAALLGGYGKSEVDAQNAALVPLQEQFLSGTADQRAALAKENPRLTNLMPVALQEDINKEEAAQKLADEIKLKQTPNAAAQTPLGQSVIDALSKKGMGGVSTQEDLNQLLQVNKIKGEDKLTEGTVNQINDKLKALAEINAAKDQVDKMGGDSFLGGLWRNVSQGYDPNSELSQYRRSLPALADQLAKGYAGTARQYNIQQMQKTLDATPGETGGSVKDALDLHANNLTSDVLGQLEKLKASGRDTSGLEQLLQGIQAGSVKDQSFMGNLANSVSADASSQTKVINGTTYVKVPGGWQAQ